MRFSTSSLAVAAIALLAGASSVQAQAQTSGTRFGVEAAYADHFNLGLGAFVKFHLTDMSDHAITGRVTFDYFFPGSDDECLGLDGTDCVSESEHYFQIDADALYDIANPKSNLKPYVGAGLGLSHFSVSGTDCFGSCGGIGLNILGGINFAANTKLMPFVEVKLGIAGDVGTFGGTEFVLKGGIHF